MKKICCSLLIGLFCLAAPFGVQAEDLKIDMGKATCQDFLDIDDESVLIFVYAWLEGYASAKSGKNVTDIANFEAEVTALAKACETNPEAILIQSVGK